MALLEELLARWGLPSPDGPTWDSVRAPQRKPKAPEAASPRVGDPTAEDYDMAAAEAARAKLIADGKTGPATFTPDQAMGGPRIGLLAENRIRPRISPAPSLGDPAGSGDMGQAAQPGTDVQGYKGGAPLMGMLAEKEGYTGAPYADPNGVDLVANQPLKPGDPLPPLDAPITVPDRPVATGDVPQGPSTDLSAARGPAKPGPAAEAPDPFGKTSSWDNFLQRLTDNRGTLLALAGGFAGARNIGEGMSRAFTRAAPIAAVESQRTSGLANQRQTYKALVARGVPPAEALAAATNPKMADAIIKKYYETGAPLVVNGNVLTSGPTGDLTNRGYFPDQDKGVPHGYRKTQAGGLEFIPGGPEDPAVKASLAQANTPNGYYRTPQGEMKFIVGGPADPEVLKRNADAQRDPTKATKLTVNDVEKLGKEGGNFRQVSGFAATFKPEFSGYKLDQVGDAANFAGRRGVKAYEDQAKWWQDYQSYKNVVRNAQFGSALTATEAAEFNKADISTGMSPEMIRRNLARQQEIIRNNINNKAAALIEAGYDRKAVLSAYGIPTGEPAAEAGGGITIRKISD